MKTTNTFLVLLTVLAFSNLFTQPAVEWTKTYLGTGDRTGGYVVQQTKDNGYIMGGCIKFQNWRYEKAWCVKTDSMGDTIWTKWYDIERADNIYSVEETDDGGYILGGFTQHFNFGYAFLIKTDSSGNILWLKKIQPGIAPYGIVDTDCYSLLKTSDGGYMIAGKIYHLYTPSWNGDGYLMKIGSNGNRDWTKTFGGSEQDYFRAMKQTQDGGYILAGVTFSTGAGYADGWLVKTDSLGNALWEKTYGTSASDYLFCMHQTNDQGYILAGFTQSSGSGDIWLIKTDSMGNPVWTKTFGGERMEQAQCVKETPSGGYIILGSGYIYGASQLNPWLIRTDTSGDSIWTKVFSTGTGHSIKQTNDGGYIIAATMGDEACLIKLAFDPTSIKLEKNIPNKFTLSQNYPNPFNPSTTIEFDLPKTTEVSLRIFNILGEKVATLISDRLSAGSYSYDWDASNLASGVYLYRLQAGDYVETRKMVLIR